MSTTDNPTQRLRQAIDRALTFSDDVVDDRPVPFDDLAMRDRALAAFDAELGLATAGAVSIPDAKLKAAAEEIWDAAETRPLGTLSIDETVAVLRKHITGHSPNAIAEVERMRAVYNVERAQARALGEPMASEAEGKFSAADDILARLRSLSPSAGAEDATFPKDVGDTLLRVSVMDCCRVLNEQDQECADALVSQRGRTKASSSK